MSFKLHVVICSTRPGRIGPKVATWFAQAAGAHGGFDVELVDLADFDLPVFDEPKHPRLGDYQHEHTKKWAASVSAADAFVFVTPEYNYFPPVALVNAVTYLAKEWAYKPAAFVGYGGISGALRAIQAAKPLLTTLRVMPIPEAVPVPVVGQYIGEDGVFRPSDPIAAGVKPMLDELARWTAALKPLRG